jgi:hypothetical protein
MGNGNGGYTDAGVNGRELEHGIVSQRLSQYLASGTGRDSNRTAPHYLHPLTSKGPDHKSPSYIAATLAASRSGSPSPNISPGVGISPAPLNPHRIPRRVNSNEYFEEDLPDTSSLATARSLISMFDGEDKRDDEYVNVDPVKRRETAVGASPARKGTVRTISKVRAGTTMERSPNAMASEGVNSKTAGKTKAKPRAATPPRIVHRAPTEPQSPPEKPHIQRSKSQRTGTPHKDLSRVAVAPASSPTPRSKQPRPKPEQRSSTPPPQIISRSFTEVLSPEPRHITSTPKLRPPTPPKPRGANRTKPSSPVGTQPADALVFRGNGDSPGEERPARPMSKHSDSSNDSFVSASSGHSPEPGLSSRPRQPRWDPIPRRASSARNQHTTSSHPYGGETFRPPATRPRNYAASSSNSTLPLSSLASAMVASSLATQRLTPSNTGAHSAVLSPPPPLPKRQKSPHLRETLRKPLSKSDDEGERRRKKAQGGSSGKHKHHEGARRRWREEITLKERKRYEAVWASNRGLLLDQDTSVNVYLSPEASEAVVNIVVRDIWKRSRLPPDELAEVWDLVDRGGKGMLSKQEFVVGMWLVDQRLRGRKIPAKVSGSVWDSAKGVRVIAPKGK